MRPRSQPALDRPAWCVACACLASACAVEPERSTHAPPSTTAGLSPLPTPRHGHRAERVGDAIVVFGGYDAYSESDDRGTRETWIFSLAEGAWRRGADAPLNHAFGGSAVVDGAPYAIGDDVERYDARADRWDVVLPAGSAPRSHLAAAAVGPLVYVLGGFPALHGGAFALDTRTNAIVDVPEPPEYEIGDHLHVLAALDGELHVVGGLDSEPDFAPSRQHWIFDGTAWRAGPPPPRATWAKFAATGVLGSELFVFEGAGGMAFDARASTWRACRAPELGENGATAFVMPATVTLGRQLLVLGGEFPAGTSSGRIYDAASDAWSDVGPARAGP